MLFYASFFAHKLKPMIHPRGELGAFRKSLRNVELQNVKQQNVEGMMYFKPSTFCCSTLNKKPVPVTAMIVTRTGLKYHPEPRINFSINKGRLLLHRVKIQITDRNQRIKDSYARAPGETRTVSAN